jgi:hypothetical protein
MQWYWYAITSGIILPWFMFGKSIITDFKEGGAVKGFGVWFGMCWVTVPITLLAMWVMVKVIE